MSRAMEIVTYILTKHVVKDPATLRSIPDLYLQSLTAVIHTPCNRRIRPALHQLVSQS